MIVSNNARDETKNELPKVHPSPINAQQSSTSNASINDQSDQKDLSSETRKKYIKEYLLLDYMEKEKSGNYLIDDHLRFGTNLYSAISKMLDQSHGFHCVDIYDKVIKTASLTVEKLKDGGTKITGITEAQLDKMVACIEATGSKLSPIMLGQLMVAHKIISRKSGYYYDKAIELGLCQPDTTPKQSM